jgi:hypothetical protein
LTAPGSRPRAYATRISPISPTHTFQTGFGIDELDRARCRAEAERRFSPSAMAEAYEQVYAALLAGERVRAPSAG